MSKKFLPIMLVLVGASIFIAFKSQGGNDVKNENPRIRFAKILKNVGILLEEGHYSPKKIDDEFSKAILKRFEEDLDNERNVFLQSDIDSLKIYQNSIDDEIHGAELKSFYAITEKYIKRQKEVSNIYVDLLSKPFDFTENETVQMEADKLSFPKNEVERKEVWRKRIKFLTLGKYTELLEQRKNNKSKKNFVYKADTTLEREARDIVRKQMDRYMTTKKNRETIEENFSVFVNDIVGSMDPHSDYFAPIDLRSFNESIKGSFFGIGAQLKEEDGKIKIGTLITGMPAFRSGEIKENDEIIKIGQGKEEPIDVTGYAVNDAVKLIRGAEKGSEVKLTLKRLDGTIKVVSLLRDEINLEDTFAKSVIINSDHKIGYIYLPEFYADFSNPKGRRCAADVAKEITKLKKENIEGIIIDLRRNGGGSLYDVVQMAGLFIEDGPIVQVKSRGEKPNVLRDRDKSIQYSGPLAVLVDETSASASEIFAAAIQDYKRGVIIGSTSSYGKGTVQRTIPLNPESENTLISNPSKGDDLGSIKLTLQKFYRINGGATQLKGVTPDIILPDGLEYVKFREKDNNYALKWDEIEKVEYNPWTSNPSMTTVIAAENAQTMTNPNFSKIKINVDWLSKNIDKEYSLNQKQYEFEMAQQKSVFKELENAYKLTNKLNVKPVIADTIEAGKSKDKMDRNKVFVKKVSDDIYINEAVNVINKMITNDVIVNKN